MGDSADTGRGREPFRLWFGASNNATRSIIRTIHGSLGIGGFKLLPGPSPSATLLRVADHV